MPRFHRSKVDPWLRLVIVAGALLALAGTVAMAATPQPVVRLLAVPIAVLGAVLPLWVLLGTTYRLEPQSLEVRCGPFRWHVPIREIQDVRPTRNPLSSPALSLDRLRIEYGERSAIMISPRDRERFLRELSLLRAEVGAAAPAWTPVSGESSGANAAAGRAGRGAGR
ncbi:MAG: PH domain-containing protein [Burkholderiales bacterium]|nr:MAG: PH domain-containing protein [Burkholderiales bacterium]